MKYLSIASLVVLLVTGCSVIKVEQTVPEAAPSTERQTSIGRVAVNTPALLAQLPTPAATIIGGTWESQGPAPIGPLPGEEVIGQDLQATGAAHSVLAHPTNADRAWVSGVNGGIWRTDNATSNNPTWTPLTDDQPSLSIGAMDLDPTDSSGNTIVAGFGRHSSLSAIGGLLVGALRSTDGGTTWAHLTDSTLEGQSCSGIAARGSTIVFSASASDNFDVTTGMFRSTDTGATWTQIDGATGSGLPNAAVMDLVGDKTNTQRLYATSQGQGVYRSDDTGATWIRISDNSLTAMMSDANVDNAEMSVASNGRLYVAVVQLGQPVTIQYSDNPSDASPSWVVMDMPTMPDSEAGSITITGATNASPIVVTTSTAHSLRDPGGVVTPFVQISGVEGNTAANGIHAIEVLTDTTFSLRLSTGNGDYTSGGQATKVWGLNPKTKPGSQGGIHFSILADQNNSNIVYVGGDAQNLPSYVGANGFTGVLWRGDTSRAPTNESPSPQWEHLTDSNSISGIPGGGTASGTTVHADSREMVQDARGDILQTDDGGIYRRTNPTSNTGDWTAIQGNMAITEQHNIAYDTVSNIIISGNQDNGTTQQVFTGSKNWKDVTSGDGGDVAVDIVSAKPNSIRYVSSQSLGGFARNTYDADNKQVSQEFPELTGKGAFKSLFVPKVVLNNVNPARMVIAGTGGFVESADKGDTATHFEVTDGVNGLAYGAADNADILYVASFNKILVRESGTGAPSATLTAFPGGDVTDMMVHPDTAKTLFVADNTDVYMTTDAGLNWTNIKGDLTNNLLRSLEYVPGNTPTLLVGGVRGVSSMALSEPGVWQSVGTGLPNTLIYDMDYDSADDVLVAGSLGRGAWLLRDVVGGAADTDGDGIINSQDTDDDGDGVADAFDDLPLDKNETTDTDKDGIGNNADTDDDGDGILDADDPEPLVANILARNYLQTASTSKNVTRLDIVNRADSAQKFTGTLYNGDGTRLGNANTALASAEVPARGRITLTSQDIETLFGVEPWSGPAMLEVRGTASFSLMAKLISPSGLVSNTNCVREDRVLNVEGANSSNRTFVRFINISDSTLSGIKGTLYGKDGSVIGTANVELVATLNAKQAVWLSREDLASKVGATWDDEAMLEVTTTDGLKLLNLNLVNGETFFNFSCFEDQTSQRAYIQTTSTSKNVSFTHLVNTSDAEAVYFGNLYNEAGERLGEEFTYIETVPAKGRVVLDSNTIETWFNVPAWSGPAILEVFEEAEVTRFELMTKLTSPSGLISNTNCVRTQQVHNIEPPGSSDRTFIRFINNGKSTLTDIKGRMFDANGNAIGSGEQTLVSSLAPNAATWLNRDQLSSLFGASWTGAALLEVSSAPSDLRLLNLNLINGETFFNFSCYEEVSK